MSKDRLEPPRETTLYRLCDFFGVPVKGKSLEMYMPGEEKQRQMVLKALYCAFGLDFTSAHISRTKIEGMVKGLNTLLFKEPSRKTLKGDREETISLIPEAIEELTMLAVDAIQKKYLFSPKEQFQLVKNLRDAGVQGSGDGQHFCFDDTGKAVLDVVIDAFGWKEFANQNPEGLALAYRGMSHRLQTLAGRVD